ncbi:MAG: hypothetical protein CMI53_00725 [Parcubacteria group bacterium]|jgi:V/A-type H+-transporting ATPase subunit E|nr:hypothetical protein [Parcubacteria group bacterium]|tara:strand:+ start:2269 stop:2844 length:576 start_codon:yes stop_codon:yes gene_type:complete
MALDDIKKAILAEADTVVEKAKTEGNQKIAKVQADWSKKIDNKKQTILASAQRKANQKVQQTQFKIQAQVQTEVLNQKQILIDKVYQLALQKLNNLDNDKYVELMEKLINKLPADEGELISVKDKESLLAKASHKSNKKFTVSKETVSGSGGFIFRSKDLEINDTFATLVNNSKDETILSVSNLLFNENRE